MESSRYEPRSTELPKVTTPHNQEDFKHNAIREVGVTVRSLPTPEICGSNLVIGTLLLSTIQND